MADDNLADQLPEKIKRRLTPVGAFKGREKPASEASLKEGALETLKQKAATECERVRLVNHKVRESEAQRRQQIIENRNVRLCEAQTRREIVIRKRQLSAQSFASIIRGDMSAGRTATSEVEAEDEPDSFKGALELDEFTEEFEKEEVKRQSSPQASVEDRDSTEELPFSGYVVNVEEIQNDIEQLHELSPLLQYLILDFPIPSATPASPPDLSLFPEHVMEYIQSSCPLAVRDCNRFKRLLFQEIKGEGVRGVQSPATRISTILVHFGVPSNMAKGEILLMSVAQILALSPPEFSGPWEGVSDLISCFRRAISYVLSENEIPNWFATSFYKYSRPISHYSSIMDCQLNQQMLDQLAQQVSLVPLLAQEFDQYGADQNVLRELVTGGFNKNFKRLISCLCPHEGIGTPNTLRQARSFASRALYSACRSAPYNLTHKAYTSNMEQLEKWVDVPAWDRISTGHSSVFNLQMVRSLNMMDDYTATTFYCQFYDIFRCFCVPSASTTFPKLSVQDLQGIKFLKSDCSHMLGFSTKYVSTEGPHYWRLGGCVPKELIKTKGLQAPFFTPHCRIDLEMLIMSRFKIKPVVEEMHKHEIEEIYFRSYSPLGHATLRFSNELKALFDRFRHCKKALISAQWKYWYFLFIIRAVCDLVPTRDDYNLKLFDYLSVELEAQMINDYFANHPGVDHDNTSRSQFCSRAILNKILSCIEHFGSTHREDDINALTKKFRDVEWISSSHDTDEWFDNCVNSNLHIDLYLLVSYMLYDMRVGENISMDSQGVYYDILQEEVEVVVSLYSIDRRELEKTFLFLKDSLEIARTKVYPGDVRNICSSCFHDPLLAGFARLVFRCPENDVFYGQCLPEVMFSIYRFIIRCQIESRALILSGSILLHTVNAVRLLGYKMKSSLAGSGMVLRAGRRSPFIQSTVCTAPSLTETVRKIVIDHPQLTEEEVDSVAHAIVQNVDLPVMEEEERMRAYSQILERIRGLTTWVVQQNGQDIVGKVLLKRLMDRFLYDHSRLKNKEVPTSVEMVSGFDNAAEHLSERMGVVWKTHYQTHAYWYLDVLYEVRPDLKPTVLTRPSKTNHSLKRRRSPPRFR